MSKSDTKAQPIFITPAHFVHKDFIDSNTSPFPTKKTDTLPVAGYGANIKEVAKVYDIPVLDFYNDLGIDPNNEEDKVKYTFDGLHFNDAGHRIIAKKIGDFLLSV